MSRIAFLTPLSATTGPDQGGLRNLLTMARAVARLGEHDVTVATIDDSPSESRETLEDHLTLRRLPAAPGRRNHQRLSWSVMDVVRHADLLHIDRIFSRASEVAVLAGALVGKPVCAGAFGSRPADLGRPPEVVGLIDAGIAASQAETNRLSQAPRLEVIPCGIDTDYFNPGDGTASAKQMLVVLGTSQKHDVVADLRLPTVDAVVRGVDIPDEEARELFQRAFAVVATVDTALDEPAASRLLLQAAACGAAVICPDQFLTAEYVLPDQTGYVFHDHSDLLPRLRRLSEDPELAQGLGRRAREEAVKHHGLQAVGSRLSNLYALLLRLGPRAAAR